MWCGWGRQLWSQLSLNKNVLCAKAVAQCLIVIWFSSSGNILDDAGSQNMAGQNKHQQKCVSFFGGKEIIKKLSRTKDAVYHWSHRFVWNNGVLDVAQSDGSLVYLYIHISQGWVLARKAQGWETKSSHQTHMCTCPRTHTLTHAHTQAGIQHYRASLFELEPGMALHGPAWPTITESSTEDNSTLRLFKGGSAIQFFWQKDEQTGNINDGMGQ